MAGREAGADGLRNRRGSRAWRFTAHAVASPDAEEHRQKRADLAWTENKNGVHGGAPFIAMHDVFCRHCDHWLSRRGMLRETVLSSVPLFSTDKCPDGVTFNEEMVMPGCSCRVQDFKCGCGLKLGYQTLETCSLCSQSQHEDKDHKWILSADCVTSQPCQLPNGDWKVWNPSDQLVVPKVKQDENLRPSSVGAIPPLPKYTKKDDRKADHTPFSSPLADLNGRPSADWKSSGPARFADAAGRQAGSLHVTFAPQTSGAALQPNGCSLSHPGQHHPSIDQCFEPLNAHLEGIKQREAWLAAKEEHLMMLEHEMLQQSRRLVDSFCHKAAASDAEQMNLVLAQLETMKAEIALMQRRHSKESLAGDSRPEEDPDEESEAAKPDPVAVSRFEALEAQLAVAEADAAAARAERSELMRLAKGRSDDEAATASRLEFASRMIEKEQGLKEWEETLKTRSAQLDERERRRLERASADQQARGAQLDEQEGRRPDSASADQGRPSPALLDSRPLGAVPAVILEHFTTSEGRLPPSAAIMLDRSFDAVMAVLSFCFAIAKAFWVLTISILQHVFYATGVRLRRLTEWAWTWRGGFYAPLTWATSRPRRFSVAASPAHHLDGSGVPPAARLIRSPAWSSPGRSSLGYSATTPGWSPHSGFSGFAPSPVMPLQPVMEQEGWGSWIRRVLGFGRQQYASIPVPQVIYTPQPWSSSPW